MKISSPDHHVLFLYEGETEGIFYEELFSKIGLTRNLAIKKKCVCGIYNLNAKVADKIYEYLNGTKKRTIKKLIVVVAYDRECPRTEVARLLNTVDIIKRIKDKRLAEIHQIVAVQMLESWFFIDIHNIFKYLKTPESKCKPFKYADYERFRWSDLDDLFSQSTSNKKRYKKGQNCQDLIKELDVLKIYQDCEELKKGINILMGLAGIEPPQKE